jgi:HTH-type transcriptional regulator/antitoxin HigA
MSRAISVEPFPPGEYIQDELDARGWTHDDLAEVIGRTKRHVSRLLSGETAIGSETAVALGQAFGTSAEMWINLQTSYELSKAAIADKVIAQRADLYSKAPVRELKKRNWIPADVDDVSELNSAVLQFLQLPSWDAQPKLKLAARKSTTYASHSFSQLAWGCRALQLGACVAAAKYRDENIEGVFAELRKLIANPEDIRRIPALLASLGIRLVIVEHLPKTLIDGAAMWLDESSPVIALSLRIGRIDNFWFNLFHELVHIKYRHAPVVDIALNEATSDDDSGGEAELVANREAANYLIPSDKMESFIARHRPVFYQAKVIQFANIRGVHPGIVVGQLHHQGVIDYRQLTKLIVDIRPHIKGSALTDGWGDNPLIAKRT